jgi:hypothetical protein
MAPWRAAGDRSVVPQLLSSTSTTGGDQGGARLAGDGESPRHADQIGVPRGGGWFAS